MVFTTAGGGANQLDTGYEISNSLRFNDGDSAELNRSFTADPDTRKKFTISFWAKRGELGSDNAVFGARTTVNFWSRLHFDSSDRIRLQNVASGATDVEFEATPRLRDPSAWYHIVFAVDTTQASISDGVKLYINGERITDTTSTNYTQNATFEFARNGTTNYIGRDDENSSFFDGYISEFYYVDNQQLAPTDFGETNDNGVWIPIDAKDDITFGANGFYLEFKQTGTSQDSSGIGADTSGNDEHFAVSNLAATDVTTDTPTNNFCTANPLNVNVSNPVTFAEGNLQVTEPSGNVHMRSDVTMYPSNGKWYGEFTFTSGYSTANGTKNVGIITPNAGRWATNNDGFDKDNGNSSSTIGYRSDGKVYFNGSLQTSGLTTFTINDIIGIAMDLDNDKLFISKNGTFFSNGTGTQDPANGTNPIYSGSGISDYKYHGFGMGMKGYGDPANVMAHNFGNPYTSISSGNSDANGYGNFEYAVPSGYYALCTKNLAEYG